MRERYLIASLCLATVVGCRATPDPAPASSSVAALDSAAYVAVLDSLLRRDRQAPIPVAVEFLPLSREHDTPATREWLARELPTVTADMFAQLETIPPTKESLRAVLVSVHGAPWIDSTTLMSRRDVATIRFGIRLSPVAYSADSTEAVVYAVVACGAVCGSADYCLLRQAAASAWRVQKILRRWTG